MRIDSRVEDQVRSVALSSMSRRRVGCLLFRKNRLVVSASNMEGKTHPFQSRLADMAGEPYRRSLHAEIRALLRAKEVCDTLVVVRLDKSGKFRLSKPCSVCQLAIAEYGLKNVYYSTDDGSWGVLELPS